MPTLKMMAITEIGLATCLSILGARPGPSALLAGDNPSVTGAGKLRDTILALDDRFWEAASRHDVEALGRLFADDFLGLGHDGVRWTRPAILEQHRAMRLGD